VGEIGALIGPNGSGKSTLFKVISGHERLDSGTIVFAGKGVANTSEAAIANLGLVRLFQDPSIYAGLTCADALRISSVGAGTSWLQVLRRPAALDRRAEWLLDAVGLTVSRNGPAGELSFGQQRLLELAMVMQRSTQLVLLDEPTAGLSPAMVELVARLVKRSRGEFRLTFLIVEHNLSFVLGLADRVHCMSEGRIVACGTPAEIRRDPAVATAYLGAG
jgi:ABC-type branched-subunit amino acid transport system ATPase component